ncbi:MAG: hypothetical protein KQ78_01852 [Candidatus Izimaplasma bacterium HR2]|nr:MAG: hypothetical protein KQ78_01852 [Candidatus Izimaplasma bacterium HR2]
MITKFGDIYKLFIGSITEKLYINMTKEQTEADAQTFLILSIAEFKYCKLDILDFNLDSESWNILLTLDEISHLVFLMKKHWLKRQIDNTDLYDQKIYADKDIKVYSQANHLGTLLEAYKIALFDVKKDKDDYNRIDGDRNAYLGIIAGK